MMSNFHIYSKIVLKDKKYIHLYRVSKFLRQV